MAILNSNEVRRLYDEQAGAYDASLALFRLSGLRRWRASLINALELSPGDTVVDLCCGTGENLLQLARAVGSGGRVVGVDLSAAMLERAREKVAQADFCHVELIEADVATFDLPPRTRSALSTFGLEMVPEYERVIARTAHRLPVGGRLGLIGLKHPQGWPDWMINVGVRLTRRFGVSRDYERFRPREAARQHMAVIRLERRLLGAGYLCVAEKRASACEVARDRA